MPETLGLHAKVHLWLPFCFSYIGVLEKENGPCKEKWWYLLKIGLINTRYRLDHRPWCTFPTSHSHPHTLETILFWTECIHWFKCYKSLQAHEVLQWLYGRSANLHIWREGGEKDCALPCSYDKCDHPKFFGDMLPPINLDCGVWIQKVTNSYIRRSTITHVLHWFLKTGISDTVFLYKYW